MKYAYPYKYIDIENYPRRTHFEYFSKHANPYVSITVNVDITELIKFHKENSAPFFLTLLFCASRALNSVPELRQRIIDDQIVEFDLCPSSHTVANPNGTFAFCELIADCDLKSFVTCGILKQQECALNGNIHSSKADELPYFFVSITPWFTYTALTMPTPIPADSNPRITFGKYFEQDGKTNLPLTLLFNHALVDGLHISRFLKAFDDEIKKLRSCSFK